MRKFNPLDHPICFSYPLRVVPSSWMEHVPFAMFLIDVLKPRLFVELGTALGVSYCAFCQAVKELGLNTRCYAVDTWEGDSHTGQYESKVLDGLRKHHDPIYGSFSTLIQGTFDDALTHFENGTIDLLHIDGFHTYDAVRHDFNNWLPKMSEEGVILFHDINVREKDFGVWQLWEELKQKYVHFDFSHEHGLGLLVVGRQPVALEEFLKLDDTDSTRVRDFFYQLGLRLRHSVAKDEETSSLWNQLVAREADFARERAELEGFSHQVKAAQKEIKELSKQLVKKDQEINSLSVELADKYRELQELSTRQVVMAREALTSAARMREREKEQERLKTKLAEQEQLNTKLAEQEQRNAELANQQAELAAQIAEQQQRNAELAQQNESLKAEIESLSNEAGHREQFLQSVSLELADRNSQLHRINTSFGGRLLKSYGKAKYSYLLPIYRLMHLAPPQTGQNHNERTSHPRASRDQSKSADEDKGEGEEDAAVSNIRLEPTLPAPLEPAAEPEIRLGIILPENDVPSNEQLNGFVSKFGSNHHLIVRDREGNLQVLPQLDHTASFDSLPLTHLYEPAGWTQRLSDDHLRNALLSLKHTGVDFVLVSNSLSSLPVVAISSPRNAMLFPSSWGAGFADSDLSNKQALGRVLRLVPPANDVTEVEFNDLAPNAAVNYQADQGLIYLNRETIPFSENAWDTTGAALIPGFHNTKPTIFLWPIFMAVGGAERNAIEVMQQLKGQYHFVVITMERLHPSLGSLHHQLKNIAEAVYDLGEIAPFGNFLNILSELKDIYDPDLVWITNGSPWLGDHAEKIRELFADVPIVDQQVYDTHEGWINRYHEPGIQSFDRFVAINKKIRDVFLDRFKMDPERIDLIYHAVNSDRFNPSRYSQSDRTGFFKKFDLEADCRFFLFAGRLTRQKRPLDFLKLALKIQEAGNEELFVMVGDGELSPEVDEFIGTHELRNLRRIPFVENMAELFSIASGLVLTSEFEGLPIVMLEALCMGLPVLATDVGDIQLILEEYQSGRIIPEIGNIDSLTDSYGVWARELEYYRKNAEANSGAVRKRFSGENVAREYAECWERARASASTGPRSRSLNQSALVSIIIPSYNHAAYLQSAIDSVLRQSHERMEVIVIDDGSQDNSLEILRQIDDPRFKYFAQENQGAHAAINRGLQLAKGEFLTILNSDDLFHPDRIKQLLSEFAREPQTEMVSSWIEIIDADGKSLGVKQGWHNMEPWPIAHPELSFKTTDDFSLNLLMGNFVATTSNIMMRRNLYDRIGGMRNLRFTHDWDFVLRAAAGARCKLVSEPLMKYRVHDTNTITSDRAWMLFEICWVLAANLHRFEGLKIFGSVNAEQNAGDLERLYESINLQGNDKLFWVIRAFIQSLNTAGVENSEELLLEDTVLRNRLIEYVRT
jgi:glycosyltransferase involved in cell wall biosynthesis